MAWIENHIGIFLCGLIVFMIFLVPIVSVHAVNSVEDGKWDFTIIDIRANQIDTFKKNMLIEIAIGFEGTEITGTADVIFIPNGNYQVMKTVSNIKQDETRWVEFEISQNQDYCLLSSAKVIVTTPGFKNDHVFDEKTMIFVPYQNCIDSDKVSDMGNTTDNIDYTQDNTDNESAIESFEISNHILEMNKGKIHYVTIYGNIAESKYLQGHDLRIIMTKPDGIQDNLRIQVTSSGKFETVLRFDFDHSMTGKYTFEPTYMERYKVELTNLIVTKSFT